MKKAALTLITLMSLLETAAIAQEWKLAVARPSNPVSITVPAGSFIEFGTTISPGVSGSLTIDFGNGATLTSTTLAVFTQSARYAGPVTFTQSIGGGTSAFYAIPYRITDTTAASVTPSNSVVIPANAAGPVQIILESSTDLITWTAATPGNYSASTTKRFFRVRAVQQ